MAPRQRPVLWLDVETGGLNPHTADLLTVGLHAPPVGRLPATDQLLMLSRERYRAGAEALSVNRLSLSRLREQGQPPEAVDAFVAELLTRLHRAERGLHLGGHNLDFDLWFVEVQLPQTHAALHRSGTLRRQVDTARVAVLPIDAGLTATDRLSLAALCREFGVTPGNHDALGDAQAAARLYAAMVRRLAGA